MSKNELEQFFDNLPDEEKKETVDEIFDGKEEKTEDTSAQEENKGEESKPEKDEEPRKNRRHRRLEEQLRTATERAIRAEAEAEAARKYGGKSTGSSDEVDPRWLRIYGDTPETREAWRLQQDVFSDYKEQIKEETRRELAQEQSEALKVQREHEELIESELEGLEDEFNVDLTSDAPAARKARREFLSMVERASPKDEDGNVISYADFGTVYEYYQLKNAKKDTSQVTTRQKEISSRTMNKSNSSSSSQQTVTPGFDGWRKDYNLD